MILLSVTDYVIVVTSLVFILFERLYLSQMPREKNPWDVFDSDDKYYTKGSEEFDEPTTLASVGEKKIVTSYGLIVFHRVNRGVMSLRTSTEKALHNMLFLIQKRKYTYQYIDLLCGRWSSICDLSKLLSKMTPEELRKLRECENWYDLMKEIRSGRKHVPFKNSLLREYIIGQMDNIDPSPSSVWEFPKGRKDKYEGALEAALREFREETGIATNEFELIDTPPILEMYKGTDGNVYYNRYFVMETKRFSRDIYPKTPEVAALSWCSFQECLKLLPITKTDALARVLCYLNGTV